MTGWVYVVVCLLALAAIIVFGWAAGTPRGRRRPPAPPPTTFERSDVEVKR